MFRRLTVGVMGLVAALMVVPFVLAQDKPGQADAGQAPAQAANDPNAGQSFVQEYDKNKDGTLSREEMPAVWREVFQDLDTNNDQKLGKEELQYHAARMRAQAMPVEVISIWVVESERDPLSRKELQNVYDLLRKTDEDNDGQLAQEELKAARAEVVRKRIDAVMTECDKNSDGRIAKDECKGFTTFGFERIDKNNDSHLDRGELEAAAKPQPAAGTGGITPDQKKP
jgi:Ca2+-binding EF-hand superfamily protein